MMWAKLFVSVFIMSETGSVATTAFSVELEMSHCQRILPEFNRKHELQRYNLRATIDVKGYCEPLRVVRRAPNDVPPQALNMLNGFLQGLQ
jgi:hypothetical protein